MRDLIKQISNYMFFELTCELCDEVINVTNKKYAFSHINILHIAIFIRRNCFFVYALSNFSVFIL